AALGRLAKLTECFEARLDGIGLAAFLVRIAGRSASALVLAQLCIALGNRLRALPGAHGLLFSGVGRLVRTLGRYRPRGDRLRAWYRTGCCAAAGTPPDAAPTLSGIWNCCPPVPSSVRPDDAISPT